jgi:hypothetical protein
MPSPLLNSQQVGAQASRTGNRSRLAQNHVESTDDNDEVVHIQEFTIPTEAWTLTGAHPPMRSRQARPPNSTTTNTQDLMARMMSRRQSTIESNPVVNRTGVRHQRSTLHGSTGKCIKLHALHLET